MRTADDYVLDFRHDDGSAMMTNFHGVPSDGLPDVMATTLRDWLAVRWRAFLWYHLITRLT